MTPRRRALLLGAGAAGLAGSAAVLAAGGPVAAARAAGFSEVGLSNWLAARGPFRTLRDLPFGGHPRQRLDLHLPDAARDDAPVLVVFHGGGFRGGDKGWMLFGAEALCTLGGPVVMPNYRLSPEHRWPDFVADGAAVLRRLWSGGLPGIAPGRPALLCGYSAGAFIAAALASDPRWLGAEARALMPGVVGFGGLYGVEPGTEFADAFAGAAGGRGDPLPAEGAGAGPPPPMLLLHGDSDAVVPHAHAEAFAARLRARGGAARLVLYPGVGHFGVVAALSWPVRTLRLMRARPLDEVAAFAADPGGRAAAAA